MRADEKQQSEKQQLRERPAALLFALLKIKNVYGEVLSRKAIPILEKYGIKYSFGTVTVA